MLFFISVISLGYNRASSLLPALLHIHLIFLCFFGESTFCHLSVFSVFDNLFKPICCARQTPKWSLDTISWACWDLLFSKALFSPCLSHPQDLKLYKLVMTILPKLTFICKCLNKYLLLVYSCSNRAPLLHNKCLLGLVLEIDQCIPEICIAFIVLCFFPTRASRCEARHCYVSVMYVKCPGSKWFCWLRPVTLRSLFLKLNVMKSYLMLQSTADTSKQSFSLLCHYLGFL